MIDSASLEIAANQFIGIVGPNGGGKTTFLKLMLGLLKPDKGSVLLNGKPPKDIWPRIGYVPQAVNVDKDFPISVFELVLTGGLSQLSWWGSYPADLKNSALEILDRVGIKHLSDRPFSDLSGGEKQRALIARALINKPLLLALDEPTANIDVKATHALIKLLCELKDEMSIALVTHDFEIVSKHVDHVLCVQNQVNSLTPKDVCHHYALGIYHDPHLKHERKSDA